MKKKLLTLQEDVALRLEKEKNQSATANEAIERWLSGRDGAKALAKLTQDNTEAINEMAGALWQLNGIVRKIAAHMNEMGVGIDLR